MCDYSRAVCIPGCLSTDIEMARSQPRYRESMGQGVGAGGGRITPGGGGAGGRPVKPGHGFKYLLPSIIFSVIMGKDSKTTTRRAPWKNSQAGKGTKRMGIPLNLVRHGGSEAKKGDFEEKWEKENNNK